MVATRLACAWLLWGILTPAPQPDVAVPTRIDQMRMVDAYDTKALCETAAQAMEEAARMQRGIVQAWRLYWRCLPQGLSPMDVGKLGLPLGTPPPEPEEKEK
jgi:hypothetical protein